MADYNSRNDIPWAEAARDYCNDSKEVAVAGAGMAAVDATQAELDAAGVFAAGAGVGFAVAGQEHLAAGSEVLAAGFLNPYTQEAVGPAAGAGAEHFTNEHWGSVCDGLATGINGVADGTLAISNFAEQMPAPHYVDAKLGYDPETQSEPTFDVPRAPEPSSPEASTQGPAVESWFNSWTDNATPSTAVEPSGLGTFGTSFWGGDSQPDTSSHGFGSWFGSSSNEGSTSSASASALSSSDTAAESSSSSFGSLFGLSSEHGSSSSLGSWGDFGGSLSHGDSGYASFSDTGSSSSSSSSGHDSGSGSASMDGGL